MRYFRLGFITPMPSPACCPSAVRLAFSTAQSQSIAGSGGLTRHLGSTGSWIAVALLSSRNLAPPTCWQADQSQSRHVADQTAVAEPCIEDLPSREWVRLLRQPGTALSRNTSWMEEEEEEEEEFFNHYKNDLKRHAHTPSGVAGADLKS
jgi:hypothetical protein